jgi:hypothetical protein
MLLITLLILTRKCLPVIQNNTQKVLKTADNR